MNVTQHDWDVALYFGLVALMALGLTLYAELTTPKRHRRRHAR